MTDSTRWRHLARLAVARLRLGHRPEDVVMAAIAASHQAAILPPVYDHVSPEMRDLALALFDGKPHRCLHLAQAVGRPHRQVSDTLGHMVTMGLLRRHERGWFSLRPNPPARLPTLFRPCTAAGDHLVDFARLRGVARPVDVAKRWGIHKGTALRRLQRLVELGRLTKVPGGYAIPTRAATTAA